VGSGQPGPCSAGSSGSGADRTRATAARPARGHDEPEPREPAGPHRPDVAPGEQMARISRSVRVDPRSSVDLFSHGERGGSTGPPAPGAATDSAAVFVGATWGTEVGDRAPRVDGTPGGDTVRAVIGALPDRAWLRPPASHRIPSPGQGVPSSSARRSGSGEAGNVRVHVAPDGPC
jgi:hypothetical protein